MEYITESKGQGYCGGESVNALYARTNGKKPFSEWTKADIIRHLTENGTNPETINKAKRIKAETLKWYSCRESQKHHIGKNCKYAMFYHLLEAEKIAEWLERSFEAIKEAEAEDRQAKTLAKEAAKQMLSNGYFLEELKKIHEANEKIPRKLKLTESEMIGSTIERTGLKDLVKGIFFETKKELQKMIKRNRHR